MDPISLLGIVVPFISKIGSRIVDHFTGAATPQNATEAADLIKADAAVRAALPTDSENESKFVASYNAIQRPLLTDLIIGIFLFGIVFPGHIPQDSMPALADLVGLVISYWFGQNLVSRLFKR